MFFLANREIEEGGEAPGQTDYRNGKLKKVFIQVCMWSLGNISSSGQTAEAWDTAKLQECQYFKSGANRFKANKQTNSHNYISKVSSLLAINTHTAIWFFFFFVSSASLRFRHIAEAVDTVGSRMTIPSVMRNIWRTLYREESVSHQEGNLELMDFLMEIQALKNGWKRNAKEIKR